MEFWQQYLAMVGVMAAILTPFAVIHWWMTERYIREMRRETERMLREMDERQQEASEPRPEGSGGFGCIAADKIARENRADRPFAVDEEKEA